MFRSYRFILLAVLLALLAAVVPATSSASTTPAPLVIEGPTLSGVLQDAAVHIEACRCQQNVSRFHFERTFILTIRLTIYMGNGDVGTASAPTPESRFVFEGPSLPDLFRNAAGTLDRCGCANEVFDVTYERTPGGMHRLILHLHRVSPDVVLGVAQDNSLSSTDILPIVVEGPALSRVLSDAAERLVQCGCQGSVVNMFYERVPNGLFRLTIFLGWATVAEGGSRRPAPDQITFEGQILPDVLNMAATYVGRCVCQNDVQDITYWRSFIETHVLTLTLARALQAPPPDQDDAAAPASTLLAGESSSSAGVSDNVAVFIFEDRSLVTMLGQVTTRLVQCNCQDRVSHVVYERPVGGLYRLSIFLGRPATSVDTGATPSLNHPDRLVIFEGFSLPALFLQVAQHVDWCGCQREVFDIRFERPSSDMYRLILNHSQPH